MEPAFRPPADRQRRFLILTWWGSVAALVFYLFLPWFVHLERMPADGEPFPGFRRILWLVAVIQIGVVIYWIQRSLSKEALMRALRGTAIDPVAYYTGKQMAAIAIAQSVAVYGLVLALVGGYFYDQYLLTLISGLLLLRQYPPARRFEELRSELEARD